MERGLLTASHEDLVGTVLITQLRSVALARLELDGDLLLVEQVGAFEDDAKGALADLLADAVVDAYDVGRAAAGCHCVGGVSSSATGMVFWALTERSQRERRVLGG